MTDPLFIFSGLIYLVCVAALIWALRTHRFSHLRRGQRWTLLFGIGVVGVGSTLMVGAWGYSAARHVLYRQIVNDMEIVGNIIDQQTRREMASAFSQMSYICRIIAHELERNEVARLQNLLEETQKMNPHLLQLRITDPRMSVLAEHSSSSSIDPMSQMAAGIALEGRAFASDPKLVKAFKKYVLSLGFPIRSSEGNVIGMLEVRYDVQDTLQALIGSARFNANGYGVIVDHQGRVIAHPDLTRVDDDLSKYPAVQSGLKGETGSVTALNKAGIQRLFFYRPLDSPATVNPKPLVLLTEIDYKDVAEMLGELRSRFILAALIVIVVGLFLTYLLSINIQSPLLRLISAAKKIESGDLSTEVNAPGKDEFGQLSVAVNSMVRGLRERETIKQVFGQYVASQVSEKVLKGEVNLSGETRTVTILFSDVRGFTAMSEKMTPLQIVSFLNDYFSEMVDAVFENRGMLDKFIGDGLMAVFGAIDDDPNHARQAVRTGLRMKALVGKINGAREIKGLDPIKIGVGIHTDEIILGNIGSRKRLQYTAIGDGVNTASRIETLNKDFGTTVLISAATFELVKEDFECSLPQQATLRGKSKPIECYEVLSEREESSRVAD